MKHVFVLLAAMLPAAVPAAECVARSGPSTVALVELYTSEGCSSCPPADRWLSRLASLPAGRVVPVAFHVTYWDHIGWRDAFGDRRHTARQEERAKAGGARFVYTPQVMLGGRDFRDWSSSGTFERAVQRINLVPARARIELRLRLATDGSLEVDASATLEAGAAARDLALVVAATQNGLSSRVTAGENKGEHLRHDFVVRGFSESRGFEGGRATARVVFKRDPSRPGAFAAVGFVQDARTGEVLQAISAPACS